MSLALQTTLSEIDVGICPDIMGIIAEYAWSTYALAHGASFVGCLRVKLTYERKSASTLDGGALNANDINVLDAALCGVGHPEILKSSQGRFRYKDDHLLCYEGIIKDPLVTELSAQSMCGAICEYCGHYSAVVGWRGCPQCLENKPIALTEACMDTKKGEALVAERTARLAEEVNLILTITGYNPVDKRTAQEDYELIACQFVNDKPQGLRVHPKKSKRKRESCTALGIKCLKRVTTRSLIPWRFRTS